MPDDVRARIDAAGGVPAVIEMALPAFPRIGRVVRASTSAGVSNRETGETYPGSGGLHIYLQVADGTDIPRFLTALHQRLWLLGFGWLFISAAGIPLERSPVDRLVGGPERPVFEGPPIVEPPLVQDQEKRRAVAFAGETLDTRAACPTLDETERNELQRLQQQAKDAISVEIAKAREAFVNRHIGKLLQRNPQFSRDDAAATIHKRAEGFLDPDAELLFDEPVLGDARKIDGVIVGLATVADVLANPVRFGVTP